MEIDIVKGKIYEIRGHQVILDKDLAELYNVETKNLNKAVKRNIERFEGEDFMFQLTKEECLRFQIGTLNGRRGQHIKYMPYAFTELGVSMLSSVLRSESAIKINREIMRAFVAMRHLFIGVHTVDEEIKELKRAVIKLEILNEQSLEAINDLSEDNQKDFDNIYLALSELAAKLKENQKSNSVRKKIGF